MPPEELIRVVIDTNIYISAIFWGGLPRKVIDLGVDDARGLKRYQIFLSIEIIDEIRSVLERKFGLNKEEIDNIELDIFTFAEIVSPKTITHLSLEDPEDEKLLNCAAACKAGFLITGDRHLLKLRKFGVTRIVTAREFLAAIGEEVKEP